MYGLPCCWHLLFEHIKVVGGSVATTMLQLVAALQAVKIQSTVKIVMLLSTQLLIMFIYLKLNMFGGILHKTNLLETRHRF